MEFLHFRLNLMNFREKICILTLNFLNFLINGTKGALTNS